VFPARYELNSYIVFRKRLVSKRLSPILYGIDKANIITDCLAFQFRAHDLCDCDCRCHAQDRVDALLAAVDEVIPVTFSPCDGSKESQLLKLVKPYEFYCDLN
jgi:hypothetical protein